MREKTLMPQNAGGESLLLVNTVW